MFFQESSVIAGPDFVIFLLLCVAGYDQYLGMKIDAKKIVMGVPWYGYDYKCLNLSQVKKKKNLKSVCYFVCTCPNLNLDYIFMC